MNFKRWIATATGTALVMICSGSLRAQTQPSQQTPFTPGTYNLSLSGSYVDNIRFSEDYFYNFNLTAGYYFWKNSSINVDLQGSWVTQPGGDDDALLGAIGL